MFARGIIDPDGANPRTAFRQIREGLAAKGFILTRNEFVWAKEFINLKPRLV
jgi:hypothetical protein